MATTSKDLTLGELAPRFSLPDVIGGKTLTLDEIAGSDSVLVMFLCRHCPYVRHVEPELARLGRDYAAKAIKLVGISANDAGNYPDDAPPSLAAQARAAGFGFPYLYDETQATARAYGAACTPEFFLFDRERRLTYHGRLDGSSPGNRIALTGSELRCAIDAVLSGRPAPQPQHNAIGCGIKWK
jgi:thiol-disulfide isomerase/thioredoxin